MRPFPMLTFAAALALATAASAQRAPAPPPAPPPPAAEAPIDLPPIAEDQAQADAMKAQLAEFDARIRADELSLTAMRDTALAKENTRIRAIKPALPLHGTTWIQLWP